MRPDATVDVLVLGAGPSGSAAALRLLSLGYRVAMVECRAFPRPQIGESLSPGIWGLLDFLEARSAVGESGPLRDLPARVAWERRAAQWIPSSERGPGVVVDRSDFDSRLLALARARGAGVIQPARARRIDGAPGSWRVVVRGPSVEATVEARLILDARGRAGSPGRSRSPTGPPTLAVWSEIDGDLLPRETRIAALDVGWLWGSPLPDGRHRVMAFLDPASLSRGGDKKAILRRLMAGCDLFEAAASRVFSSPARSCSATPYLDGESWRPGMIKVGESAMAVDPLSSSGVERSMRLSLQAVIAANTLLRDPARADLAGEFYASRLAESAASHAVWTRGYYVEAGSDPDSPFWRDRSSPAAWRGDEPIGVAALFREAVVRLEARGPSTGGLDRSWIERASPCHPWAVRIAVSDQIDFIETPCVVEDRVQLRPAIKHPSLEHPIGFLEGYEVVPLLRMAPLACDLGHLVGLWSAFVPRPVATRIAGWLGERGVLLATSPS